MSTENMGRCIRDEEIEKMYTPYVYKEFSGKDPVLLVRLLRTRMEWKVKRIVSSAKRVFSGPPRPPEKVKQNYEQIWDRFQFGDLDPALGTPRLYLNRWRNEYQEVHGWGVVRVHLYCLMRLIAVLKPRSVLEVGFGRGLNLIALSARFPEIEFSGLELSESGFNEAQELTRADTLPQELIDFIPFPLQDTDAVKRIHLHRGSAESLPFDAGSIDLVYTRQALEQMEFIRDTVLHEISRVAGKNVVMFEAFRDWNATGMCRDRNSVTNYFAARLSDLPQYGLKPVYTRSDLPTKIYMHVGLAVAEKEQK
jgi:ubiquinone/menaquinone biosynthesis C-methylase UbiE